MRIAVSILYYVSNNNNSWYLVIFLVRAQCSRNFHIDLGSKMHSYMYLLFEYDRKKKMFWTRVVSPDWFKTINEMDGFSIFFFISLKTVKTISLLPETNYTYILLY